MICLLYTSYLIILRDFVHSSNIIASVQALLANCPSEFLSLKSHTSTSWLVCSGNSLPYRQHLRICSKTQTIASKSLLLCDNFSQLWKVLCCNTLLFILHHFVFGTNLLLDQFCLCLCLPVLDVYKRQGLCNVTIYTFFPLSL